MNLKEYEPPLLLVISLSSADPLKASPEGERLFVDSFN